MNLKSIKQNKKYKPKQNKKKSGPFYFDYVLKNRHIVSRPNTVWQIDFTQLETKLQGQPDSSHYLFFIIDVFSNKIITSKVFFMNKKSGTLSSYKIVKLIDLAINQADIKKSLIINTDRGPEFSSDQYIDFIKSLPNVIGSHSEPSSPWQNAIVERVNRSYKSQTKQSKIEIPDEVKQTRDLQNIINRKTFWFNNEGLFIKNFGLTVEELLNKYHQNEQNNIVVEPDIVLARNTTESASKNEIIEYKLALRHSQNIHLNNHDLKKLSLIENMVNDVHYKQEMHIMQNKLMEQKIDTVIDLLATKPKRKHEPKPDRQPLNQTIYKTILNYPKPKRYRSLNWSRFKIACIVLFYSGLRINEVSLLTKKMCEELINNQKCDFYQSKVNRIRTVPIAEQGSKDLDSFRIEILQIFDKHTYLYPGSSDTWIKLMNNFLLIFSNFYKVNLKSHSFRINYVTELLKVVPTHHAQELVGHKDIRSTQTYNKYKMSLTDKKDILDKIYK